MNRTEMEMLNLIIVLVRRGKVRNEYIRGSVKDIITENLIENEWRIPEAQDTEMDKKIKRMK